MLYINSILLGIGLAMDAFSVSLVNGLGEPCMKRRKMSLIAGVFAAFQFMMPMLGWFCVTTVVEHFNKFKGFIPWIALILLLFIGIKMLVDGITKKAEEESPAIGFGALMIQGVATSIDALSVGFTTANNSLGEALISSLIIGAVTFALCFGGIAIGKRFGMKLADRAQIVGGLILIGIGIEIFVKGVFFA
ncbi:MAG: manganese efflux pump MntP family protein [Lachnospiraceae bacterium]|nr:manganese efflux pump MntP family protein [Lachnospiraceae bacterium]